MTDLTIQDATIDSTQHTGMPVTDGGYGAGAVIFLAGPGSDAAEILDAGSDIEMSGMVNPHAYMPMTLSRRPNDAPRRRKTTSEGTMR